MHLEEPKKKRDRVPVVKSASRFIVRFVPAYVLILLGFYFFGHVYTKIFMPISVWGIETIHPAYDICSYSLKETNNVKEICYVIKINRAVPDKQGNARYGPKVELSTVASVLYIYPIIIFPLILSWPGLSIKERLKAALLALPLIIAVTCLDLSASLISQIDKGFGFRSTSGQIRIIMFHFLSNGGRQFLSVLIFLFSFGCLRFSRSLSIDPNIGRNAPCPCGSGRKYKHCCMPR